jgi:hypothetical protein
MLTFSAIRPAETWLRIIGNQVAVYRGYNANLELNVDYTYQHTIRSSNGELTANKGAWNEILQKGNTKRVEIEGFHVIPSYVDEKRASVQWSTEVIDLGRVAFDSALMQMLGIATSRDSREGRAGRLCELDSGRVLQVPAR